MPDKDPGDIFLQHREAVLEALLSDPALGWTGAPATEQPPFGELDDDFDVPGAAAPDPAPSSGGGPKASERILALLNGHTATSEFEWSDYAPPAEKAPELPAAEETADKLGAPGRGARSPVARFADPIRDLALRARQPKVALAVAGVLVLVVVLALLTSGGEPENTSGQTVLATATGPANPAPAQPTSTAPAAGTPIQIKSAQSHCPPGGTPAMDAFAGTGKAWSCPRAYKVDGQILVIDLGRSYRVDSIGLVPGWDAIGSDGGDQWAKYRTASRISYKFDDANATTYTQQTLDQRALVVTKVSPEISATKIVLTVLESKGDPTVNSVALSSIVVTGH
ncbi:discoidin domain-containing protein [Nocardia sp. NBC_01503]|uniref:discoidin domain-containing protein n=1 Tax=Nocardia sp. NBC_01503 TaxID=2975997 RepID=UPI002E7C1FD0|nr:discoidin domain-containing protein [Nocardia sp. NBC_01503]WTL29922.1 discoidin domain-containing protein [Nocardia sp. NBC_01503]